MTVAVVAAFLGAVLAMPALAAAEEPSPTSTPDATPSATPSSTPSATPTSGVTLDNASIRWGINNESNARGLAPNTYNILSAGKVPDHGGGTITRSQWRKRAGHVRIEKRVTKGKRTGWRPATWAGLSTDAAGKSLVAGTFSGHAFVFRGGTGSLDRAAGTAHIEWDGDLTIAYYSGLAGLIYLSDPVLDVKDGVGTLSATISGYASSRTDMSTWQHVAPRTVTVAELSDVTLSDQRGFSATPAYLGAPGSDALCPPTIPARECGSFPASWVDTMEEFGTASYWYTSGAAADRFKVPLPITIAYDDAAPVDAPSPTATPTKKKPVQNPVRNPIKTPKPTATVTRTVTAAPSVPSTPSVPSAPVVPPVPTATAPMLGAPPVATQLVAIAPTSAAPAEPPSETTWIWWLGGGLLLAAALTLLVPVGRPRRP